MRWFLLLFLLGCGDDGAAPHQDAAPVDARPDSTAIDALPSGCDYVESADLNNDTTGAGTAEVTNVGFDGTRRTICGSFSHEHFDGDITVDVDAFHVELRDEMIIRLEANAASIELAGVDVYQGASFNTLATTATWYGDHGVTAIKLPAGTYELLPYALNSTAIASTVDYRVTITADDASRCVPVTTGGILEANDGDANTGNDVYAVPSGAPIALTADTTDAPEPAGTVAPGTPVRIAGSLADVAVADQYEDRDTFAFEVPNGANELTVLLDWEAGAGNLDFMLFEGANIVPETRAIRNNTSGREELLYAIKAGVTYSIMFAAKPGATFPVAYNATLCSNSYVP